MIITAASDMTITVRHSDGSIYADPPERDVKPDNGFVMDCLSGEIRSVQLAWNGKAKNSGDSK